MLRLTPMTRIVSTISRLGGEFKPGRLVQVDVIKPAVTASLDRRLVNEILDAMQTLHSIRHDSSQSPLQEFKEKFQDRYQDRAVPLLEALDDETGIGFESDENPGLEPLLDGIDFRPMEEIPPASDEEKITALSLSPCWTAGWSSCGRKKKLFSNWILSL